MQKKNTSNHHPTTIQPSNHPTNKSYTITHADSPKFLSFTSIFFFTLTLFNCHFFYPHFCSPYFFDLIFFLPPLFFDFYPQFFLRKKIEISLFLEYPSWCYEPSAPLGPAAHSFSLKNPNISRDYFPKLPKPFQNP